MEAIAQVSLLASAQRMIDMLHRWEVVGVPELAADGEGSVRQLQKAALDRVLKHLGLEDSAVFYGAVLDGASPQEALRLARHIQADCLLVTH